MTRVAQRSEYPDPPEEVAEYLRFENPCRFLDSCSSHSLTPTVVSLLQGMREPERAYAWLYCECQVYGGRPKPLRELRRRYYSLIGRGEETSQQRRDQTETDGEPERPESTVEESESIDEEEDVEEPELPFEDRVDRAYDIATSFSTVAEVRERLNDEVQRDSPRKHVVAALNKRLDELDDTESDVASDERTTKRGAAV